MAYSFIHTMDDYVAIKRRRVSLLTVGRLKYRTVYVFIDMERRIRWTIWI